MAAKNSKERQTQIQDQFMRTARIGKTMDTVVDKIIKESKNKKVPNLGEPTAFIGGVPYYGISAEEVEAIKAKNLYEIKNREAIKKAKRKVNAEKKKAAKIKADAKAKAETERLFKDKISRMAKAQIKARAEAEKA